MDLQLTRRTTLLVAGTGFTSLAGCAAVPDTGSRSDTGGGRADGPGASNDDSDSTDTSRRRDETTSVEDGHQAGQRESERAPTDGPTTATPADGGDTTDEPDLGEANVTDVVFERRDDGRYRFDVTLYHDDDGEGGYADWWDVETVDGKRLGRRELLHAHSTAPFTRSATIDIPEGTTCVVVRGHDQTHGFGGRVMLVDLETGASRAVQTGEDRRSFTAADCP